MAGNDCEGDLETSMIVIGKDKHMYIYCINASMYSIYVPSGPALDHVVSP